MAVALSSVPGGGVSTFWYHELPACNTAFKPFAPLGCYNMTGGEVLEMRSEANQYDMTQNGCAAICKGNGFRYAGLAYVGVCYCGTEIEYSAPVSMDNCFYDCSGDKSQKCGGDDYINLFHDTTFPDKAASTVGDYKYKGCWNDNGLENGRALIYGQDLPSESMTTETCLEACLDGGYRFAGTEYYGECFCGVTLDDESTQVPDSECSTPCLGNVKEMCGGAGRLSVYENDDYESNEPCGYSPPNLSYSSSLPSTPATSAPPPPSSTGVSSTPSPPQSSAPPPPPPPESSTPSPPPPPKSSTPPPPPPPESSTPPPPPPPQSSAPPPPPPPPPKSSAPPPPPPPPPPESSTPPPPPPPQSSTPSPPPPPPKSSAPPPPPPPPPESSTHPPPPPKSSTPPPPPPPKSSTPPPPPPPPPKSSAPPPPPPPPPKSSAPPPPPPPESSAPPPPPPPKSSAPPPPPPPPPKSSAPPPPPPPPPHSSAPPPPPPKSSAPPPPPPPPPKSSAPPPPPPPPPATITTKPSPSTTKEPVCVTTVAPPRKDQWCRSDDKWKSNPLSDWKDGRSCMASASQCFAQVESCFKNGAWPGSMDCYDYKDWCFNIVKCCQHGHKGSKDKDKCLALNPPNSPTKPVSTTTVPCPATQKQPTTSSSKPSPPAPTPSSLCGHPESHKHNYGKFNPVGGIHPPIVQCNNMKSEFERGSVLKLYDEKDSWQCKKYNKEQLPQACQEACEAQHSHCMETYARGCHSTGKHLGEDYGKGKPWEKKRRDVAAADGRRPPTNYFAAVASRRRRRSDDDDDENATVGTFGNEKGPIGHGRWDCDGDEAEAACQHQYEGCKLLNHAQHKPKDTCETFDLD